MASPSEERRKQPDLTIGLALIGQRGGEQMVERLRLIQEKYRSQ
jgi:hypothetical protein